MLKAATNGFLAALVSLAFGCAKVPGVPEALQERVETPAPVEEVVPEAFAFDQLHVSIDAERQRMPTPVRIAAGESVTLYAWGAQIDPSRWYRLGEDMEVEWELRTRAAQTALEITPVTANGTVVTVKRVGDIGAMPVGINVKGTCPQGTEKTAAVMIGAS